MGRYVVCWRLSDAMSDLYPFVDIFLGYNASDSDSDEVKVEEKQSWMFYARQIDGNKVSCILVLFYRWFFWTWFNWLQVHTLTQITLNDVFPSSAFRSFVLMCLKCFWWSGLR